MSIIHVPTFTPGANSIQETTSVLYELGLWVYKFTQTWIQYKFLLQAATLNTLTLCYFVEFTKCILVVSLLNWPQMSTTPSLGVGHLIKGCSHCLHPMSTKWALGSESLDQGCGWSRWHSQRSLDSQSTALSLRGDSPVMIYIYPLFTAQWPPLFEYYRMLVPYATNRQDTLL